MEPVAWPGRLSDEARKSSSHLSSNAWQFMMFTASCNINMGYVSSMSLCDAVCLNSTRDRTLHWPETCTSRCLIKELALRIRTTFFISVGLCRQHLPAWKTSFSCWRWSFFKQAKPLAATEYILQSRFAIWYSERWCYCSIRQGSDEHSASPWMPEQRITARLDTPRRWLDKDGEMLCKLQA
jgi:hypothetical protein